LLGEGGGHVERKQGVKLAVICVAQRGGHIGHILLAIRPQYKREIMLFFLNIYFFKFLLKQGDLK
jgi:hypothetical protein